MMKAAAIAAALLSAGTAPPPGQAPVTPPPELCDAPPAFAAWVRPVSLVAATRPDDGPVARMTMGQAAALTLSPGDALRPAVAVTHGGGPLAYAGLLRLAVPLAGTYRFALSGPAWLDVVEAGRSIPSTAHGHGEPCGPIRKLVDLPLTRGDHFVQITGAPTPNLTIMAIRVLP